MFFKKRLARFYRSTLQGKRENVKLLAQDMESYISRKQDEVADYRDYLNRAYNQLVQGKIEEYENARELYNELSRLLLEYSQCSFEIHLIGKQKQEVFMDQRLCGARKSIISEYHRNYCVAIGECKELIQLLEDAMNDTPYNYLVLYQNQKLLETAPEKIEECAKNVKYADLQRSLYENSGDDAAKNAWFYAKTVGEELSLYRKEAEQVKVIRRQIYGKKEDCKTAKEQLEQMSRVFEQRMEELKARQQCLQDRQQQLFTEARRTWTDYVGKSKVCMEYDYEIFGNQQKIDLLQKEIEAKKGQISGKNSRLETIKNTQSSIKSKKDSLIELNKSDGMQIQLYIADIKKIRERRSTYLGIAARARERGKSLRWEHKNLCRVVRDIKNSHTNDPGFTDKIDRLNSLSYDINTAKSENDTYMGYVETCNREEETVQSHIDYYKECQERRNGDIDRYKAELESLSENYSAVKEEIDLLYAEISAIQRKKKPYRDAIASLKKQKKAYIGSQFDKFKELTGICRGLLEG